MLQRVRDQAQARRVSQTEVATPLGVELHGRGPAPLPGTVLNRV